MPANSRHLDTTFVNLTLSHKEFFTTGIGAERSCDAIKMSATARGLTLKEMKSNPGVMTNINVNSPRKLGDTMAYGTTQMSDYGTPDRRGLNVGRTASIVNGNLTIYAKTGVGHPDQISRFNSANTPASQ